ncbi:MAG: transglutaminase-like domain-containing protein [Coriobacteriia bacterium]|nr:transglutaminase-like domain-containing protein [Coriobacteriia bacterium]MCL2749720.1 transglutaminase-like domain-containing protein [Coriobacteriia bacterium]
MKRTLKHRLLSCALAFLLVVPVSLAGCALGAGESEDSQTPLAATAQAATAVATALQEKYEDSQRVRYAPGENDIARDHQFVIEIEFNHYEYEIGRFSDICGVFYDAELTQRAFAHYEWVDEDELVYIITPGGRSDFAMLAPSAPERAPYGFTDDLPYFFQREPYQDWGDIGTLYLATKRNLVTGEILDKPIVQIYNIRGELDTPDLTVEVTENGLVQFSWNAVKGAKAYYILRYTYSEEHNVHSLYFLDSTTETQWSSKPYDWTSASNNSHSNKDFSIFYLSEDDWNDPLTVERHKDEYDPADGAVIRERDTRMKFCVVAVNEQGNSMLSRFADINDVASIAPFSVAYKKNRLEEDGLARDVEGIENMPCYSWIVLCNGTLAQRVIVYDFEGMTKDSVKWLVTEDETLTNDAENLHLWDVEYRDTLLIPYQVEGTAFTGTVGVYHYDASTAREQLELIRLRMEALQTKTGSIKIDIELADEDREGPVDGEDPVEIVIDDTEVTANSALSEFLALSMLSGATTVDLSLFPESLDMEYLGNAWSEAYYQNPLILGISDVQVSRDGKTLFLDYQDDPADRERKQNEIKDEVARVIPTIITSSMTPRDKEFAINQYLCDTVEYDMAALENGEQYDYKKVDPEFNDSFTAYGAIVNGVGVCASYAASFKLLADAAGLNSVVVTGYIDGSLGHAWNRVELSPGRWATIDVTSNDSELMPNAILNVPDHVVATTLVEDNRWVMASAKSQYTNNEDADEYYRVTGMYFEADEVVGEIVSQLASGDFALVRTDYMLSEDEFSAYCEEILQTTQKDIAGYYWAGIIIIVTDVSLLLE